MAASEDVVTNKNYAPLARFGIRRRIGRTGKYA